MSGVDVPHVVVVLLCCCCVTGVCSCCTFLISLCVIHCSYLHMSQFIKKLLQVLLFVPPLYESDVCCELSNAFKCYVML